MTHPSDWPVPDPIFGRILANHLAEANAEPKPQVAETFTRCSSAGACARQLSIYGAGIAEPEPFDVASLSVMEGGTAGHERFQTAVKEAYPDAVLEAPVVIGNIVSGSADVWLPSEGVVVEMKNPGGFEFEKAVGISKYKRINPEGPRLSARLQGALYAYGLEAETLVVVYRATQAISKQRREALGLSDLDAFWAEWSWPREVWLPWAERELARLDDIRATVDEGNLADRWTLDDMNVPVLLDPEASKPNWRCAGYCPVRETCVAYGPGVVAIEGEDVA